MDVTLRGRGSVTGPQSQAGSENSTEGPARILRSGAAFFSARAWKSVSLAANGGYGKLCLPHPALLLHGFVGPSAKGIRQWESPDRRVSVMRSLCSCSRYTNLERHLSELCSPHCWLHLAKDELLLPQQQTTAIPLPTRRLPNQCSAIILVGDLASGPGTAFHLKSARQCRVKTGTAQVNLCWRRRT